MAQKKTTPKSRALARSAGRAAGAQRAAAKKTSAKQERAAVSRSISKPTKVAEQGVGWGNVARAAASVVGRVRGTGASSATRKDVSKIKSELRKASAERSQYGGLVGPGRAAVRDTEAARRAAAAARKKAAAKRPKSAKPNPNAPKVSYNKEAYRPSSTPWWK